ncbi:unnamed protein product [Clonostachys solani]|uniref:Gfd2/YDR514C-like C-terminal domain-containing protein n=1 Tax=Clonostachys solani TaxID=160281 RepID=A0A9N9YY32_9HYPO|nr:unnamed protein product [Clonostachys solani]
MDKKSLMLNNLRISTEGLYILREALGLEGDQPDFTRPILLAIDFEQTENFMNGFSQSEKCQVGLAALDTRELHTSPPEKLISTESLISGPSSYTSVVSNNVLFGTTTVIKPAEILQKIQDLIPSDRDIILIGHNVRVELRILVRLGFTFSSRISSIIDTCDVADEVLGPPHYSLRKLLKTLCCPADRLHTAGNDAHFTLRASLLLVARDFPDQDHPTIGILRNTAMDPLPHLVRLAAKEAMRKGRKSAYLNSKKYQARFRTAEQIAEIRAERAAKKARQMGVGYPVVK